MSKQRIFYTREYTTTAVAAIIQPFIQLLCNIVSIFKPNASKDAPESAYIPVNNNNNYNTNGLYHPLTLINMLHHSRLIAMAFAAFFVSLGAAAPGRLFGLQLSDPEAPETPPFALPPFDSWPNKKKGSKKAARRSSNRRAAHAGDDSSTRQETIDAAIRDVPDYWVAAMDAKSKADQATNPIAGDVHVECPNEFELTSDGKCILTVYKEPMVRGREGGYYRDG